MDVKNKATRQMHMIMSQNGPFFRQVTNIERLSETEFEGGSGDIGMCPCSLHIRAIG